MKKHLSSLIAVSMTSTFTACNKTDEPEPAATSTSEDPATLLVFVQKVHRNG